MTKEGDQLKFEHASRGSKLINLNVAFECAFSYVYLHGTSFKFQYPYLCGVC
jgi:hypothetical protein